MAGDQPNCQWGHQPTNCKIRTDLPEGDAFPAAPGPLDLCWDVAAGERSPTALQGASYAGWAGGIFVQSAEASQVWCLGLGLTLWPPAGAPEDAARLAGSASPSVTMGVSSPFLKVNLIFQRNEARCRKPPYGWLMTDNRGSV